MNITERLTTIKSSIDSTSQIHSSTVVSANEYYSNANYVSRHRTLGSVSEEKKGIRESRDMFGKSPICFVTCLQHDSNHPPRGSEVHAIKEEYCGCEGPRASYFMQHPLSLFESEPLGPVKQEANCAPTPSFLFPLLFICFLPCHCV